MSAYSQKRTLVLSGRPDAATHQHGDPAAVVAPFDYTILLWGLLLGWVIWHELPDPEIWPGAAILIGCGLYITHRETRVGRRKPKASEDAPATGI